MSSVEKKQIIQNGIFGTVAGLATGGPVGAIMVAGLTAGLAISQEKKDQELRDREQQRKLAEKIRRENNKKRCEKKAEEYKKKKEKEKQALLDDIERKSIYYRKIRELKTGKSVMLSKHGHIEPIDDKKIRDSIKGEPIQLKVSLYDNSDGFMYPEQIRIAVGYYCDPEDYFYKLLNDFDNDNLIIYNTYGIKFFRMNTLSSAYSIDNGQTIYFY